MRASRLASTSGWPLNDRHADHGFGSRSAKKKVPVPPSEMPVM